MPRVLLALLQRLQCRPRQKVVPVAVLRGLHAAARDHCGPAAVLDASGALIRIA